MAPPKMAVLKWVFSCIKNNKTGNLATFKRQKRHCPDSQLSADWATSPAVAGTGCGSVLNIASGVICILWPLPQTRLSQCPQRIKIPFVTPEQGNFRRKFNKRLRLLANLVILLYCLSCLEVLFFLWGGQYFFIGNNRSSHFFFFLVILR